MGHPGLTDAIASPRNDGDRSTVGDGASVQPLDVEELERLAAARSSCRAYLDREVPAGIIEQVLRVAGRSPSWCNVQPCFGHAAHDAAAAG